MGKAFFPGAQVTQNRTVTKMATTVTMVTDESYSPGDLCTAHKTLQKSPKSLLGSEAGHVPGGQLFAASQNCSTDCTGSVLSLHSPLVFLITLSIIR